MAFCSLVSLLPCFSLLIVADKGASRNLTVMEHKSSNHAMKRIAADVKTSFCMTDTSNPIQASLSAAIRLSYFR